MKYPTLYEIGSTRNSIEIFKGLNRNLRIEEGEFYDMRNLSSDHYPVMTTRGKRRVLPYQDTLNCVYMNGYLWRLVEEEETLVLLKGDERVHSTPLLPDMSSKLMTFGTYIILPDGTYINTVDYEDTGKMNVKNNSETSLGYYGESAIAVTLCDVDGADYGSYTVSDTAPENPADGDYWLDSSGEISVLKVWAETSAMWVTVLMTYVKIAADGIGEGLGKYDGVDVAFSRVEVDGGLPVFLDPRLEALKGSHIVWACDEDYIVVSGVIDKVFTSAARYEVIREMPEMDFVFECGNRLWGCRFGEDKNGGFVNEIYASKLGDFKNWNSFVGISTDSYAASVGSQGPFTGAIAYNGYPIFFKEDRLYKVYGSYPAEFTLKETVCHGVRRYSGATLAVVDQTLYYRGTDGIYAYDGSTTSKVSYALGEDVYSTDGGSAVSVENKYILCMGEPGKEKLYILDTAIGVWHVEESTPGGQTRLYPLVGGALMQDLSTNTLYALGKDSYNRYWDEEEAEDSVEWFGETGVLGLNIPDRKYVSRILVRLSLEAGSKVKFFIQYDSSEVWEHMDTMYSTALRTVTVSLRPHRCDHFRLRIEGTGSAKIYSITKTIEQGSDQ